MNIFSDPSLDVRNEKPHSGSYEWWYFDAISSDGRYSLVVIFYEGNPFSTRYNKAISDNGQHPLAENYPAASISIYEDGDPIYYSFTEFEAADGLFFEDQLRLKVGPHQMEADAGTDRLTYFLKLEEELPSGDALTASLDFLSPVSPARLFDDSEANESVGHVWNLVQPRAEVSGKISLTTKRGEPKNITFEGKGYHDHNTGQEPMQKEFRDWYWGRFHFDELTLVYYVMNRQEAEQHRAWLISRDNAQVIDSFETIELSDKGLSLFGLHTARKMELQSSNSKIHIQQSHLLDNGPFYQRYLSEAFLQIPAENFVESQAGITEYIYPNRIYSRIFWPFVDMRIRYKAEGPHWVQRSKTLYRWTW